MIQAMCFIAAGGNTNNIPSACPFKQNKGAVQGVDGAIRDFSNQPRWNRAYGDAYVRMANLGFTPAQNAVLFTITKVKGNAGAPKVPTTSTSTNPKP